MKRAMTVALIALLPIWYFTYEYWLESHQDPVIIILEEIVVTPDNIH
jgi:hypothetical protein